MNYFIAGGCFILTLQYLIQGNWLQVAIGSFFCVGNIVMARAL